jgi:hypothetical protein
VTALRIADGQVIWEAAPGGRLFHVGRQVVIEAAGFSGLAILDAREGKLLARYKPEGVAYHDNVFVVGNEIIGVDMDETVHVFRLPVTLEAARSDRK